MEAYGKHGDGAPHAEHHEHLSPWPVFIALGVILLYYGVIFRGPVLGAGIIMFLAALLGWIYEDYTTWRRLPADAVEHPAPPKEESLLKRMAARPTGWWGVVVFLLTEIMLFGALFAVYFNAKAGAAQWPPASAPELPVVKTLINTIILVSSGVTMHLGIMALRRQMRTAFLALFAATIVLGVVFLINQVVEYLEFFHEGFNLTSEIYGASFFSLTGIHGAHVTAGLAGLTAVLVRALLGQFSPNRHLGVETVAIYWHFVDFVWIFLFLVIYVRVV